MRHSTESVLLVDAGNLLFPNRTSSPGKSDRIAEIKAAGLLQAYQLMGYDGIGLSSYDLTYAGLDTLAKILGEDHTYPVVSANISLLSLRDKLAPFRIRQFASFQVAIIGLTGDYSHFSPASQSANDDWQNALQNTLDSLPDKCDLFIVLSSLPETENNLIAEKFPEIGVIITAIKGKNNLQPKIVNKTLIAQAGSQGKHLGLLDIHYEKKAAWISSGEGEKPTVEMLQMRLKSIDLQISRLAGNTSSVSPVQQDRLQRIRTYRQQLFEQMVEKQNMLKAQQEAGDAGNTFTAKLLPIIPVKADSQMATLVREIHTAMAKH